MFATIYLINFILYFQTKNVVGNILLEVTSRIVKDVETVCIFSETFIADAAKLMETLSNEKMTMKTSSLDFTKTQRYCMINVVTVDSLETLQKFRVKLKLFPAHSRILTIVDDVEDIDYSTFFIVCLEYDLDVLILSRNTMNFYAYKSDFFENATLHSVLRKKTIRLSNEELVNLEDILDRPKWNIVEVVKTLNITLKVLGYYRSPYVKGTNENPSGFDVELVILLLENIPLKFEIVKGTIDPFMYMNQRIHNGTSDVNIGAQ